MSPLFDDIKSVRNQISDIERFLADPNFSASRSLRHLKYETQKGGIFLFMLESECDMPARETIHRLLHIRSCYNGLNAKKKGSYF